MADRVYLSLWLDEFSAVGMLPVWAKALAEFPVSSLSPGIRELAVYPFHWGETPVLEQSFQEGAGVGEAVALAAEFLHEDYAYGGRLNLPCKHFAFSRDSNTRHYLHHFCVAKGGWKCHG